MSGSAVAASASASRAAAALPLYRSLWRAASHFRDYNFKHYAHRNISEKFRTHQHETDPAKIRALLERGQKELKMLQRQSLINQLYSSGELVIEQASASKSTLPSSFTLRSSATYPAAFQAWLNSSQIATTPGQEQAAVKASTSPAQHKYDEQKTPSRAGPMPEN